MGQGGLSHYGMKQQILWINNNSSVTRGFGGSASWLDLVNSELWDGYGNFTDMLEDRAWIDGFMKYWDFRVPTGDRFRSHKFKTLREQIRRLVRDKLIRASKWDVKQLEHLNDWLKVTSIARIGEDQNGLRFATESASEFGGWPVIMANLTSAFVDSLMAHEHDRLKICRNEDCRWVFIDVTKGNVRRWCSNATCGNRARVRKARAGK